MCVYCHSGTISLLPTPNTVCVDKRTKIQSQKEALCNFWQRVIATLAPALPKIHGNWEETTPCRHCAVKWLKRRRQLALCRQTTVLNRRQNSRHLIRRGHRPFQTDLFVFSPEFHKAIFRFSTSTVKRSRIDTVTFPTSNFRRGGAEKKSILPFSQTRIFDTKAAACHQRTECLTAKPSSHWTRRALRPCTSSKRRRSVQRRNARTDVNMCAQVWTRSARECENVASSRDSQRDVTVATSGAKSGEIPRNSYVLAGKLSRPCTEHTASQKCKQTTKRPLHLTQQIKSHSIITSILQGKGVEQKT